MHRDIKPVNLMEPAEGGVKIVLVGGAAAAGGAVLVSDLFGSSSSGRVLSGHTEEVRSAFSPDGGTLASGHVDREVRLWRVR